MKSSFPLSHLEWKWCFLLVSLGTAGVQLATLVRVCRTLRFPARRSILCLHMVQTMLSLVTSMFWILAMKNSSWPSGPNGCRGYSFVFTFALAKMDISLCLIAYELWRKIYLRQVWKRAYLWNFLWNIPCAVYSCMLSFYWSPDQWDSELTCGPTYHTAPSMFLLLCCTLMIVCGFYIHLMHFLHKHMREMQVSSTGQQKRPKSHNIPTISPKSSSKYEVCTSTVISQAIVSMKEEIPKPKTNPNTYTEHGPSVFIPITPRSYFIPCPSSGSSTPSLPNISSSQNSYSSNYELSRHVQHAQVVRKFIFIMFMFLGCWLPFVILLAYEIIYQTMANETFALVCICMIFASMNVNSYFYVWKNQNVQKQHQVANEETILPRIQINTTGKQGVSSQLKSGI